MDFTKMGTKSFVDAYTQMINNHNRRVMATDSGSHVLGQADDEVTLDLGDDQGDKEQGDEQEVSLDNDDEETPDEEEEVEGDEDQDGDQEQSFDLGQGEEELQDEPEGEGPQENIEMNFSEALAKEFVQTVNGFTKLCAQIVQKRSVPKDTADKLDKYMRKIKNVISAAEDSV